MKTTKEKIEVMQAYIDGKEIEIKKLTDTASWVKIISSNKNEPEWDWRNFDYRIKSREPRRVWVSESGFAFFVKPAISETTEFIEVLP